MKKIGETYAYWMERESSTEIINLWSSLSLLPPTFEPISPHALPYYRGNKYRRPIKQRDFLIRHLRTLTNSTPRTVRWLLWCRRQWKSRQTRSSSALGRPKKLPPEWRSWCEVGIKNSRRKQRSENGKVTKKKNAKMMEENKRCFGLEETKRDVRENCEEINLKKKTK